MSAAGVEAEAAAFTMHARLTFNTAGYYSFTTKENEWVNAFDSTQKALAKVGVKSTLEFYFGQAKLMQCVNEPVLEAGDQPGNVCVNASN